MSKIQFSQSPHGGKASIGFPQINGEVIFPKVIGIDLSPEMTYLLNRSTKTFLILAYLTLFPPLMKSQISEYSEP